MAELITVPTFLFNQGKTGENNWERRPISVQYYNGSIVLEQEGDYDTPERISINPDYVKALLKEIIKHQPDAEYWLKK